MNTTLLIRHARVIDPATGRDETADLAIREGRFVAPSSLPASARTLDAAGLIACPGLWDTHVHFRDPGNPAAETRRTGAQAAAAGGFTHVVTMPNTTPAGDNPAWLREQINDDLPATILPSACVTLGRAGRELAPLERLSAAGASCFTDDGAMVASAGLMREAMRRAKALGKTVFDHAVRPDIQAGGVIRDCPLARSLGLPIFPPEAETEAIRQDIALSRETGCRLAIQHISTAGGVAQIRAARAEGLRVFAEASPHHLLLAAEDIPGDDANWRMNPPLGTREDRAAIRAAVADNTLSLFATDHAPHTAESKAKGFRTAPFGVIGLETAVGATWQATVVESGLPVPAYIARWTTGPAEALGLPAPALVEGEPADLTLIDPSTPWTVDPAAFRSRARNCPFAGMTFTARAVLTICRGRVTRNFGVDA